MSRSYKTPSGRVIRRGRGGRFRRTTLADFGIHPDELQQGETECAGCGHRWHPILVTGICPKCGSREKVTHPTDRSERDAG